LDITIWVSVMSMLDTDTHSVGRKVFYGDSQPQMQPQHIAFWSPATSISTASTTFSF